MSTTKTILRRHSFNSSERKFYCFLPIVCHLMITNIRKQVHDTMTPTNDTFILQSIQVSLQYPSYWVLPNLCKTYHTKSTKNMQICNPFFMTCSQSCLWHGLTWNKWCIIWQQMLQHFHNIDKKAVLLTRPLQNHLETEMIKISKITEWIIIKVYTTYKEVSSFNYQVYSLSINDWVIVTPYRN